MERDLEYEALIRDGLELERVRPIVDAAMARHKAWRAKTEYAGDDLTTLARLHGVWVDAGEAEDAACRKYWEESHKYSESKLE